MERRNFLQRFLNAIRPPHIRHKAVFDDLTVVNADLLNRVRKLQATIDEEDGWFLCLTHDGVVCANTDADENEDGEVENG